MFSCSFMQSRSRDRGVAAMTMVIKFLPVRAGLALSELFRGEGGDDFFETRIAAQRIPPGKQLQTTVAECAGKLPGLCQLLQGKIFFTNPGRNDSGELNEVRTIERVFRHRQQLHRALCLLQSFLLMSQTGVDNSKRADGGTVARLRLEDFLLLHAGGSESGLRLGLVVGHARDERPAEQRTELHCVIAPTVVAQRG